MKIVIDPTQLDKESLMHFLGHSYMIMVMDANYKGNSNAGIENPPQVVKIFEKMFFAITKEMDSRNISYQDSIDTINQLGDAIAFDLNELKSKWTDELEEEDF